tara:strand:- start:56258 stop:56590 length:333 start_codon:yes stop_codon:yes gene_type:complete
MKENNGNPVPSIDINIIKTETFKIGDNICHIKNFMVGLPLFFKATDYDVKEYSGKNGIYLLKQNGVETNKEQPVKSQCSCKEPHYGFKNIDVCTDCNGIKDDEYWKRLKR